MRSRLARALGLARRAGGPTGPLFTVAPAISGTTAIGDVLSGTITAATASPGGGTVTYAWAWQRGGADIGGASGTTTTVTSYTVVAADGKANANDADVPLRLRVTATDTNGSRTVFSNVLNGPALAADNTLTLTAGDGATSGTNLLTNDEPAATAITAATFDGETITLGTPLTLADRGAVTINADGTWSFNDDTDFGDVLLGLSLDRTGTYTNDVGGTGTITVTVEGTAELAYSGQAHLDAEFDSLTAPTEWEIQGTQDITLSAVGSIVRVDDAAAGIARTEHSASDYWSYTYMQANPVTNLSAAVGVRVDGATGSIFEVSGAGGAILRAYVDGSSIKAQLSDGTFDETLTIAKPAGTFAVGVSVDAASDTFNLTVSDGDSSAATAQTVSTSGYVPFIAVDLAFGAFDGAIFAVSLKNPAAVNASSLASDVATFVGTTYHNAAPSFTAPGSLTLADAETDVTLDVSSGASGGETPYAWAVGSITGDWSGVTIDSSGVITADTDDLDEAGTAGALVTVTDARGLSASDTISVTITAASVASIFAGQSGGIYDPSDLSSLWQDAGRTVPVTTAGQTVAVMDDLSGNGEHFTCTNVTLGSSGGMFWLNTGATSRITRASRYGAAANPALTIVMAVRFTTNAPALSQYAVMFGNGDANSLGLCRALTSEAAAWLYNGGNRVFTETLPENVAMVLTGQRAAGSNYGSATARIDGVDLTEASTGNPTGVPTSTTAQIDLMRDLTPQGIAGRVYGALILIDTVTTDERAVLEAWAAERAGVTL